MRLAIDFYILWYVGPKLASIDAISLFPTFEIFSAFEMEPTLFHGYPPLPTNHSYESACGIDYTSENTM